MRNLLTITLTLIIGFSLTGCGGPGEPGEQQTSLEASAPDDASETSPPSTADTGALTTVGFDVNKVAIVNPQLGQFPFFSLIEGYQQGEYGNNKDVAFDRYEFFDGTKIIPVEGRLQTIEASGEGASAFQVFKTYESLVTGLGGVKVFEGKGSDMGDLEFSEVRHRHPVFGGDQMGVYMLRTPDREIWVESYVKEYRGVRDTYFLTIVEKKALEVRAALLPAEEMKRELDEKGHVALYINFDFDKADIRPESQPIIDEIVKLLQTNPSLNLTIEGHTDDVGEPDYNRRLSDARANSVVTAITTRGIQAGRLKAVGYGEDKPIADNSTDDGRAKNRRVELVKI
jgi:outer membrane protein OmpA-like peptidoglycan-associated protein